MTTKHTALEALELPECHFKWKPEQGLKKKLEVIKLSALDRLRSDPLNKVAYCTVLAYIHSQPETVDYKEAEKFLGLAEEVCRQVQEGQLSSDHLTCPFVIAAIRLCIQHERKQSLNELAGKFENLRNQWENLDNQEKAAVFAVKGHSLFQFGFNRYENAADAFAEANRLSNRSNYLCLFFEANIVGRIRRSKSFYELPTEHETKLWQEAYELSASASQKFDRTQFLISFVEAILNVPGKLELCKSLAEETWASIKDLDHSEKVRRNEIIFKCEKAFKVIQARSQEENSSDVLDLHAIEANRLEVVECLYSITEEVSKSKRSRVLYLKARELRKDSNKLAECCSVLTDAQKSAELPGHVYVDCMLIDVKLSMRDELNESYTDDDCLADYDRIRVRHATVSNNVATVLINKAMFLARTNMMEDAFLAMSEADKVDPTCWTRIDREKLLRTYNIMQVLPQQEHFAWLIHHGKESIMKLKLPEVPDAKNLYENSLSREPSNQFCLEHLGRLHLGEGRLSDAEVCFRKLLELSPSIECKILLAETILQTNCSCKLKLKECCNYGCKDAGEKLLKLLLQEKNDIEQAGHNWLQQQSERYNTKCTEYPPQLLQFSRDSYEICAQICNLVEGDSGFFIHPPKDIKLKHDSLLAMVDQLLEISTSEDGVTNRANELRKARLMASRLVAKQENQHSPDFNKEVSTTLKEAKDCLDRARKLLPPNTFPKHYVHGFHFLLKNLKARKRELSQKVNSTDKHAEEKQKTELERHLIELLRSSEHNALCQGISEFFKAELNVDRFPTRFHADPRTKQIFEFLVSRESAILYTEGPWLIRWIFGTNRERHISLQDFDAWDDMLAKDFGTGPKSAYEMAHRAAEFAEETRQLMMSWELQACKKVETDGVADDAEAGLCNLFE